MKKKKRTPGRPIKFNEELVDVRFKLPISMKRQLEAYAKQFNQNKSDIIRNAIEYYINPSENLYTLESMYQWVDNMNRQTNSSNGAPTPGGILKESSIIDEDGYVPSKVVLRTWHSGQFVTHIMVMPKDQEPHFVWGHHFNDLDNATKDFHSRCKDYGVSA